MNQDLINGSVLGTVYSKRCALSSSVWKLTENLLLSGDVSDIVKAISDTFRAPITAACRRVFAALIFFLFCTGYSYSWLLKLIPFTALVLECRLSCWFCCFMDTFCRTLMRNF